MARTIGNMVPLEGITSKSVCPECGGDKWDRATVCSDCSRTMRSDRGWWRCIHDPEGCFNGSLFPKQNFEATLKMGNWPSGSRWSFGEREFVIRGEGEGQRVEPA